MIYLTQKLYKIYNGVVYLLGSLLNMGRL